MMTPSTPFAAFSPVPLPPQAEPKFDVRATQRLLAELAPRIARVVRAILGGSHPELEDAQQQAMLAFVQALPQFRGECEPKHFASRIAARTALLVARRARAVCKGRDEGVDVDELLSNDAEPHEEVLQERNKALLRKLLTQIAPEQAETLTLRVVLGWSLPEIAGATGVPLNTVRSRIRLAKNALRSAIEESPMLASALGPIT